MDWIQFGILLITIITAMVAPAITGLFWLVRRLDKLEMSSKQVIAGMRAARKQRARDRRLMINIDRDNIAIKTHLKIPNGQIVIPSTPNAQS